MLCESKRNIFMLFKPGWAEHDLMLTGVCLTRPLQTLLICFSGLIKNGKSHLK